MGRNEKMALTGHAMCVEIFGFFFSLNMHVFYG